MARLGAPSDELTGKMFLCGIPRNNFVRKLIRLNLRFQDPVLNLNALIVRCCDRICRQLAISAQSTLYNSCPFGG